MADLRFTLQEAAEFLNHTMGLKVTPEDVTRITTRTEGWIAGLQMAALSMQNSEDIPGFITNLTGTHHYIFDYLIEEILCQQSPEIHRFLLYTSILDQFTAPLCDALLGEDEESTPTRPSSVILEELELIPGAIRHSFAASDWERIVRLISANIFALLEQNELNSVARQLDILISEKSVARPWLLMGRAWLAAYTGQLSSVEPILKMAESEINNLNSELELQTLGGHIAAIRAYTNWIGDRRDIAASAAQAALEWLPETDRLIRCQAATLLGLTLNEFNPREQALK